MTTAALKKRKHLLELVYSFRGLVQHPHSKEHGSKQADVVAKNSTSGAASCIKIEQPGLSRTLEVPNPMPQSTTLPPMPQLLQLIP